MPRIAASGGAGWHKNSARCDEIWLVFYKKASGKQTVSYDHAVEEALCFGWVDGLKKGLDDECYAFRFTPRKAKSPWSKSNIERVERLIAEGKMMPAGLKAYHSTDRREVTPLPAKCPRSSRTDFASSARLGPITRNFRRVIGA